MKKRIDVYGEMLEGFEWDNDRAVVLHKGDGWLCADMTCEAKRIKTAIRRFFKAVPELKDWEAEIEESVEAGYFECNDFIMGDGTRNPSPSFFWGIDTVNADDGEIYIFLNVSECHLG